MILQWFLSKTVRQATGMCKHVAKLLNHQRDILAPAAVDEVEAAMRQINEAVQSKADKAALEKLMENLEAIANKCLKTYPHAAWRENVEVLLVALAVAMGIRTFFLQPFKIPTGSMQPTLFGITSVPDFSKARSEVEAKEQLKLRDEMVFPAGWQRLKAWIHGTSFVHLTAWEDGEFQGAETPFPPAVFSIYQRIHFAGKTRMLWFPPDCGGVASDGRPLLEIRAGIRRGQIFRKGEDIVKLRVNAGDHLFVDRVTYNFRPPERGEIVVFETKGIPEDRRVTPYWSIPANQFYIKRLVGLGGERLQIGDDRHLIVNGKRLDSSVAHFENLYSFDPKGSPKDSHYSGHVNQKVSGQPAPLFPDGSSVYRIETNQFMVMGDNTMNSLDSRYWGEFPAQSVIGRALFVYWPISGRFGWSCIYQ
jgi:signal peptidase I